MSTLTTEADSIEWIQSIKDWWNSPGDLQKPVTSHSSSSRKQNGKIEYDLFRAILSEDVFLKTEPIQDCNHYIVGEFIDTPLNEDGLNFIHEFQISNKSNSTLPKKEIVIIHGYMAALGFFVKNFEDLAKSYGNICIHAIDMPGFGNSARRKFPQELLKPVTTTVCRIRKVLATESWFIDRFEMWRKQRHLAQFDLIAHSMGAYLASCYIMKYNHLGIVGKFVVVSPMGTEASAASLVNDRKLQQNFHGADASVLEEFFLSGNDDFDHGHESPELCELWRTIGGPKFPKMVFFGPCGNGVFHHFKFFNVWVHFT